MEPSETSVPTYFNSCYRHEMDEKRRLQIPAKWRPAEPGFEFTLLIWPKSKEGTCLRMLPPAQMAKMKHDIDVMPNTDPGKVVLKRWIGGESEQVTLDKSGRICIPEKMAKAAEIDGEVVLVGLLDYFEIWNPARFERVQASDAVMAQEAFKMME